MLLESSYWKNWTNFWPTSKFLRTPLCVCVTPCPYIMDGISYLSKDISDIIPVLLFPCITAAPSKLTVLVCFVLYLCSFGWLLTILPRLVGEYDSLHTGGLVDWGFHWWVICLEEALMSLLWPYFLNFSDSSQNDLSCLPAGEYQSGARVWPLHTGGLVDWGFHWWVICLEEALMSLLWPYFLNFSDSSQSDLSCLPAGEYQSGASTLGSEGRKEVKAQEEECKYSWNFHFGVVLLPSRVLLEVLKSTSHPWKSVWLSSENYPQSSARVEVGVSFIWLLWMGVLEA